uniref:Ig-like domain-containing protein n=1 Tax=Mastacembelus armatus TaxID=205130 RepID=A0A7N8X4I6_9TELE
MKTKQRDHSLLHTGWSSQFLNTAHMTPLFISVLLAAMCLECRAQKDNVLQPEGDETATEGEAVTLGCLYNSSSSASNYLYWYKQDGNNSPTFILSRVNLDEGNTPDEYRERFSSTLNSTSRSVPLKIQKLQLSDSAVYYCALQPTVTGNTKTLYKNLWSKDNTIHHNIHQRETHTDKLQWFV